MAAMLGWCSDAGTFRFTGAVFHPSGIVTPSSTTESLSSKSPPALPRPRPDDGMKPKLLTQARAIYEELGMTRWAEMVLDGGGNAGGDTSPSST